MISPFILSNTNSNDAQNEFKRILTEEPVTVLLVLGNGEDATLAVTTASDKINSGSSNYASVRVVQCKTPAFILDQLKALKYNPDEVSLNWNQVSNYLLISISNVYNNIGMLTTKDEFGSGPEGYIDMSIIFAQAADVQLS